MRMEQTTSKITAQAEEHYWRASVARDPRADGVFFLAVVSTGIYCRPTCPARRPLRRNVEFFRTQREAEKNGFRACLRCKPNQASSAASLVEQAATILTDSREETPNLTNVAAQLKTTSMRLRRAFAQITGLTPKAFAEALRVQKFKQLLRNGSSITDALYETGYGSASRIYERSNKQLGMTPAAYRKGGKGMKIGYAIAKSPLGKVLVGATERGISAVYLGDSDASLLAELKKEYPQAEIGPAKNSYTDWVREIVQRMEGKGGSRELPLDLQATAFQRRVWQELQRIPRGVTRTYSQVAKALGKPSAVRAVARACATNPVSIIVPCHRVVRADGNLAGYRWGISRKEQILKQERTAS